MLVVSRRYAESITISPDSGLDPAMTIAELFKDGPIEVTVLGSGNNRVKLGVKAPNDLVIWREDAKLPQTG